MKCPKCKTKMKLSKIGCTPVWICEICSHIMDADK